MSLSGGDAKRVLLVEDKDIEVAAADGKREEALLPNNQNGHQVLDAASRAPSPKPEDTLRFQIQMEGVWEFTYFWNIIATVASVFAFGRIPEHLWLYLMAGDAILIPIWFQHVVRFRRGALFAIDLCWVTNLIFILYFVLSASLSTDVYTMKMRSYSYACFFTVSTGYLAWAVLALNQALVFHSNERMVSLFIHLIPGLICWANRKGVDLTAHMLTAWEGYFPSSAELHQLSALEVFLCGWAYYMMWFIPYICWCLTIGLRMPAKGYATVFDNFYTRMNLKPIMDKTGFTTYRAHAAIYMIAHAILCTLTIAFSLIFWYSGIAHTVWTWFLALYSLQSGAKYFVDIDVTKFGPMLVARDREREEEQRKAARAS